MRLMGTTHCDSERNEESAGCRNFYLFRHGQHSRLFCLRFEVIVTDGHQQPNAFLAEATPAIVPGAQDVAVLTPHHQQRCKLEAAPKHEFQPWKRSAAAL